VRNNFLYRQMLAIGADDLAIYFNTDRVARGTGPRSRRMENKSIGGVQFSASEHHHPTETLELMHTRVSNIHGELLGPEIAHLQVGHLWCKFSGAVR
jgi:hypothetical protein